MFGLAKPEIICMVIPHCDTLLTSLPGGRDSAGCIQKDPPASLALGCETCDGAAEAGAVSKQWNDYFDESTCVVWFQRQEQAASRRMLPKRIFSTVTESRVGSKQADDVAENKFVMWVQSQERAASRRIMMAGLG